MENETPPPDAGTWAIIEKMGHVSLAGRLTEEERFGGKMGRVDVPQPDGSYATHYFGSQSLYGVTIVTEGAARKAAERSWPRPITPYPKAITSDSSFLPDDDGEDDDRYLARPEMEEDEGRDFEL